MCQKAKIDPRQLIVEQKETLVSRLLCEPLGKVWEPAIF